MHNESTTIQQFYFFNQAILFQCPQSVKKNLVPIFTYMSDSIKAKNLPWFPSIMSYTLVPFMRNIQIHLHNHYFSNQSSIVIHASRKFKFFSHMFLVFSFAMILFLLLSCDKSHHIYFKSFQCILTRHVVTKLKFTISHINLHYSQC